MRIGLFGGTFNPVHFGHIQVAVGVQQNFNFDHIYFIPSKCPPHKDVNKLVSASDRCEMILKSIPNHMPFSLSYSELSHNRISYSIDTVRYFKSKFSSQSKLFFILGMDAFLEFHTWESYERLTELIEFVIVSRRFTPKSLYKDDLTIIQKYISGKLFCDLGYSFCAKSSSWKCNGRKSIHHLKLNSVEVSSSLIREVIKLGKGLDGLVPSDVAKYIRNKGLYS